MPPPKDPASATQAAWQDAYDALPVPVFMAAPGGTIEYLNRRWYVATGTQAGADLERLWRESIAAPDLERVLAHCGAAVPLAEAYAVEARVRCADGTYRRTLLRGEPLRSPEGAVVAWLGTCIDVDSGERQGTGNEPQTFVALAEHSTDAICLATLAGTPFFTNEAARRLMELRAGEAAPAALLDYFLPEDLGFVSDVIWPALERDGRWSGDFRLRNARTNQPIPIEHNLFYIRDSATGEPRAIASVSHDRTERAHAERRLRTLLEVGATLSRSLDFGETLAGLGEVVVRTVASFCVVDLFSGEAGDVPTIERVATSHADPGKRALLARLREFVPSLECEHDPVIEAFIDGSSSLVSEVSDEWIERTAGSAEHAALLRELGLRSLLTVPLVASGAILGALTCGLAAESRARATRPARYDAEDLVFVEELGRRAGAALENTRLYEREHRIALLLQEASLPRTLPRVDHLVLDAEYRPGTSEATIGGDWYDAFALEDGRVVLTIGDVLGHGLRAAVTMSKLRAAMQAAAMVDPDPTLMLEVADKTLRMHDPDGYATALAAIYDPTNQTTTFASAGHPGPILVLAGGAFSDTTNSGLLLGVRKGQQRPVSVVATPAGSMLVFFTDGLTEATRDFGEGQRRLREALGRSDVTAGPSPARAIVEAVLAGEEASDDVAVLTALVAPALRVSASRARIASR